MIYSITSELVTMCSGLIIALMIVNIVLEMLTHKQHKPTGYIFSFS